MSLTMGDGPFAKPLAGELNFDLTASAPGHVLYVHQLDRRIRGEFAGRTVVDTVRARMLHETRLLPQWYLPIEDVAPGVLVESDHRTHCPFKGDARYWHLRVGDRTVRDAGWSYPDPVAGSPDLRGLIAFYHDRLDAWFEEDERLPTHPRDPFHRVDARRSSRRVTVRVRDVPMADTTGAVALFETGLPARWYLPAEDVATEHLVPSETVTICPYKGRARYFHFRADSGRVDDVAWSFAAPFAEAGPAADMLCFDGPEVSVTVES
ncbi:uncharacterized protein (DUF427 family) [Actinoalloteichus hoggarensis]|uniref:Uncharacterized protein n=1 Tax=Actinoalloteichus hoggarensis TaxID=1470176 RepID=A0A221W879_9PSEU|nr:DUF427 domain-containing protein [Actinoalloteichus hoggarensis]ASO21913.1 hypothetical protein AHOG_21485 [Actinoalloteichus hoggarensis]MBB5924536.1 uncharacterized protein (DUF427 family) [Actinoalloteichus hoggarensis]